MTISERDLREKPEGVPNSYGEFVEAMLADARDFGIGDEIASFIDNNPDLSSGYVIGFSNDG